MKKLFYATVFIAILGWSFASPVDLAPEGTDSCKTPGEIICSGDCRTVIHCAKDNNKFVNHVVEFCRTNLFCDAVGGTCRSYLTNCSPVTTPFYVFPCMSVGIYPDPYDCTVYHNCTTGGGRESVPTKCEAGWAFDSLTGRCDLPLTHWVCKNGPFPKCTEGGQSGPVLQNPNLYYVCRKNVQGDILPELFKCSGNSQYNSGECV